MLSMAGSWELNPVAGSNFLRGSEPNVAMANSIQKVGCSWQDQGWLWRQGRREEKNSPSGNVIGATGASSPSLCFLRNMALHVETLGNVPCSDRQVRQGQATVSPQCPQNCCCQRTSAAHTASPGPVLVSELVSQPGVAVSPPAPTSTCSRSIPGQHPGKSRIT